MEKRFSCLKKEWDAIKNEYSEKMLRFFIELLISPQYRWAEQELMERRLRNNKEEGQYGR